MSADTPLPSPRDRAYVEAAIKRLPPRAAAKLRSWGKHESRYTEVQKSSPLRRHGFVEPMGGGVYRLTEAGKLARDLLAASPYAKGGEDA